MIQARKTLLFNEGIPWVKKRNWDFDVPMGCLDGTDVCELVGSYILKQLSQLFEHHSVGLRRSDSLTILKGLSGPDAERVKKKPIILFNNCGLKIIIKANLHVLNFLDITLDLRNNTYELYRKQENHPFYVNNSSNHPKAILREFIKDIF